MSMWLLDQLAEEAIRDAQARGEFDDLPGQGKPLVLEDLTLVPEAWRMSYMILKRGGYLPPELERRRAIAALATQIQTMEDCTQRARALRRLHLLFMQLDTPHARQMSLLVQADYYEKVIGRLAAPAEICIP